MTTQGGDARVAGWRTFMAAHALLVQRVGGDLAVATSLSLGSYDVLCLLSEAPGGRLRLSELARAVRLTRSGVTRLAKRLEKAGLLRREADARDRRGWYAALTAGGRKELRRARAEFVRAVAKHFGSYLSDGEVETLNMVLSRVITAETGADCR